MLQMKTKYTTLRIADIPEYMFSLWLRSYRIVFFLIFFGICIWGVFLWYYTLYYFHWTDQQKQSYKESQAHSTALNERGFEKVLNILDHRQKVYAQGGDIVKNIFLTQPKKKDEL